MKKKDLLAMIQRANSRIQLLERRIAFLEDSTLVAQQTPGYTPHPTSTAVPTDYEDKYRHFILSSPADLPKGLVAPWTRKS